jgi:hypothetical protein
MKKAIFFTDLHTAEDHYNRRFLISALRIDIDGYDVRVNRNSQIEAGDLDSSLSDVGQDEKCL